MGGLGGASISPDDSTDVNESYLVSPPPPANSIRQLCCWELTILSVQSDAVVEAPLAEETQETERVAPVKVR